MEFICIACPVGCRLKVEDRGGETLVEGNKCARGLKYGKSEFTNPVRTVTSVARVINGVAPVVSVKTSEPVPKANVPAVLGLIADMSLYAPVRSGEILIKDVGNGVALTATSASAKKTIKRK